MIGPMQRIVIVGASGSGKTTLAQNLSQKLGIPHIELDALNWEPNWQTAPDDVFYERVKEATAQSSWVVDGNYNSKQGLRDLTWGRADALIWLDYTRCVVLCRVVRRTLSRLISQKPMWHNNRQSLKKAFSKDSIVLWSMQSYAPRKQKITRLIQQEQYAHLRVLHFKIPNETDEWLDSL
jgi:adenylate kinase family enzyme